MDYSYSGDIIFALIAKEITSNVRELKNIFNRVIAYSILPNEDISMKTVQKALEQ